MRLSACSRKAPEISCAALLCPSVEQSSHKLPQPSGSPIRHVNQPQQQQPACLPACSPSPAEALHQPSEVINLINNVPLRHSATPVPPLPHAHSHTKHHAHLLRAQLNTQTHTHKHTPRTATVSGESRRGGGRECEMVL